MKATEAKLLEFLKKSPQFVIPIYQRTYSWTERECLQLWNDILRTGNNEKISAHFVGSIVYVEKGLYQVSSQSPLLVIDGQQRLDHHNFADRSALASARALRNRSTVSLPRSCAIITCLTRWKTERGVTNWCSPKPTRHP